MNAPWRNAPAPAPKAPRKPRKPTGPLEWQLQAWFVNELHKLEKEGWPLTCAGDMNAAKRGRTAAQIAKLTGLTAGEPDVRIYFPKGVLVQVELKRKGGVLSQAQIDRQVRLAGLGFRIFNFKILDEADARATAANIALAYLPLGKATP